MKKLVFYVVIVIMALYFLACTRTVYCPPFDEDDLTLVPYNVDDTLRFVNIDSELFEIVIKEISPSEPYNYRCRDLHNICVCENSVYVLARDTKRSFDYWFLTILQNDRSTQQSYWYTVLDFGFEFDFINDLPYIDMMENMVLIGDLQIGGVIYEDVIEATNQYGWGSDIIKVYFNQENGILKFIDSEHEWELLSDD